MLRKTKVNNVMKLVGYSTISKDLKCLNTKILELQKERNKIHQKTSVRFFETLKKIFDAFNEVGIEILFTKTDLNSTELKLYDTQELFSYWIEINSLYFNKSTRYLIYEMDSSYNVFEKYEEIVNDWCEDYEFLCEMKKREKTLFSKMDLVKENKVLRSREKV